MKIDDARSAWILTICTTCGSYVSIATVATVAIATVAIATVTIATVAIVTVATYVHTPH